MVLNHSESEEREIDLRIFPKISSEKFITSKQLMHLLSSSEWHNAIMNCWDQRYYEFVGWSDAIGNLGREGKDIVVMFRRKTDNVEYWFHSMKLNLLAVQETK